jgi:hypothetical protein
MGPGYSNSAHSYQQDGNMGGAYGYQGIRKTFVKGKTWEEKKSLVQGMSAFGHLPGTLLSLYMLLLIYLTTRNGFGYIILFTSFALSG